jgi:hypothetical protein
MTRKPPQPAPATARPASEEGAQTGALLADLRGGNSVEGGPLVSKPKRRMSSQTIITIGVLIVGGGMLYLMRRFGMHSGMTFQSVKIDWDATQAPKGRTADEARIIAALESGSPAQVPAGAISKNPFVLTVANAEPVLPLGSPVEAGPTAAERLAELARQQREQRERDIQAALAKVQLHSVMTGAVPLAKIGEKLHKIGDKVQDMFVITAIDGRSVTLEVDGRTFTVEMGEQGGR